MWDRIRDVFSSAWAEFQAADADAGGELVAWLTEACETERSLSLRLRGLALAMPYEAFGKQLETMAREDEQHAALLQEQIEALGGMWRGQPAAAETGREGGWAGPWPRLLRLLAQKRGLYEGYLRQANTLEDSELRGLMRQLQHAEERHQEHLVELLTKLDAHRHETPT